MSSSTVSKYRQPCNYSVHFNNYRQACQVSCEATFHCKVGAVWDETLHLSFSQHFYLKYLSVTAAEYCAEVVQQPGTIINIHPSGIFRSIFFNEILIDRLIS